MQREAKQCPRLDMPRVFPVCQIFTATGRVSIAEPNLQNIPKDFAINMPVVSGVDQTCSSKEELQCAELPVSMRKIFVPFKGGLILCADYSQLELRIICHLSGDTKLASVLNTKSGDVFKIIAGQMHGVEEGHVSAEQRQQAKQVCWM